MSLDKMVDSVQLDTNLTAIADKIREANGTTEQLSFPNDFITAIDDLGREDLTYPKDVDFIDYDGRLIYSYSAEEFLTLTELPANPTNKGLIAQGWNWTLEDAQEFVSEYGALVVGQNYTTDDGRTRIYLHIPENTNGYSKKIQVFLTSTKLNSPTIYWGDGSISQWSLGVNANGSMTHEYESGGDYMIEIEVTDGQISWFGRTEANSSIVGGELQCAGWVTKVEIGDNVIGLPQNTFGRLGKLRTLSIPTCINTITDYDEMMFPRSILAVVFPMGLTTARYRAMFPTYGNIKYIAVPKSMNHLHIDTYQKQLRKLTVYSLEPPSTGLLTIRLHDSESLTHFVVNGTYQSINDDSLRSSLIDKLFIPSTVTSISGVTTFAYNPALSEIHLKPTTPPTLANSGAFRSASADCIFYVPYSSDHSILEAYKTATNWSTYASQMQEEPQS